MFGMGMPELLLILVVALVVVGPKKLPDLAKSLGKGMRQFRDAADEIKGEFSETETYKDVMEVKNSFKDTVDSLNPQGLLDAVDPAVEPKKPETDYSGRQELFKEIEDEALAAQTQEQDQEHQAAEMEQEEPADQEAPEPPAEDASDPMKPRSDADRDV